VACAQSFRFFSFARNSSEIARLLTDNASTYAPKAGGKQPFVQPQQPASFVDWHAKLVQVQQSAGEEVA